MFENHHPKKKRNGFGCHVKFHQSVIPCSTAHSIFSSFWNAVAILMIHTAVTWSPEKNHRVPATRSFVSCRFLPRLSLSSFLVFGFGRILTEAQRFSFKTSIGLIGNTYLVSFDNGFVGFPPQLAPKVTALFCYDL